MRATASTQVCSRHRALDQQESAERDVRLTAIKHIAKASREGR
jgi:hypothetical protein